MENTYRKGCNCFGDRVVDLIRTVPVDVEVGIDDGTAIMRLSGTLVEAPKCSACHTPWVKEVAA